MKIIIAGSRSITDFNTIEKPLIEYCKVHSVTEIVSGGARGVDSLGEQFAIKYNIKIKQFLADWNKHGKSAGYIRNEKMGNYADTLIAFWDGQSKGTKHMINYMKNLNKNVHIIKTE